MSQIHRGEHSGQHLTRSCTHHILIKPNKLHISRHNSLIKLVRVGFECVWAASIIVIGFYISHFGHLSLASG